MKLMIKENGVTFKQLEKNVFTWICQIGQEFTKDFLERYDRMLMNLEYNYHWQKKIKGRDRNLFPIIQIYLIV